HRRWIAAGGLRPDGRPRSGRPPLPAGGRGRAASRTLLARGSAPADGRRGDQGIPRRHRLGTLPRGADVITLERVAFAYRSGEDVLRDVDVAFGPGEFTAIVGNNGSGKSTLMKLILGLLKPTAGLVLVDGLDTRTAKVSTLARHVGFVFQNPNDQLFSSTVA